jgi:hypothetical protein
LKYLSIHTHIIREWVLQDLKGWRKFENFKLLRKQYVDEPDGYIFVGDTGELDKEAGMRMLTDRETQQRVRAIFLHVVSESTFHIVPADSYINGKPICYFRTYCGAAVKAAQHNFISVASAKEVIIIIRENIVPLFFCSSSFHCRS